jgi:protein-S-isoprenylcysteine O-methyltransferase Ste14
MTILLIQTVLILLILSINLIASLSYFYINRSPVRKACFLHRPLLVQKMYVLIFVLPLWISPFILQYRLPYSNIFGWIAGSLFIVFGVYAVLAAFIRIGFIPSIKSDGRLATTGIYRMFRHPIYTGTLCIQFGLCLFFRAGISILYFPISVVLYYSMAAIEEVDLRSTFGKEYEEYMLQTHSRVLPFL